MVGWLDSMLLRGRGGIDGRGRCAIHMKGRAEGSWSFELGRGMVYMKGKK